MMSKLAYLCIGEEVTAEEFFPDESVLEHPTLFTFDSEDIINDVTCPIAVQIRAKS